MERSSPLAKVTHLDRGWAESAPQAQQALPIMVWGCVCSLCDSGALPQLGELCVCPHFTDGETEAQSSQVELEPGCQVCFEAALISTLSPVPL